MLRNAVPNSNARQMQLKERLTVSSNLCVICTIFAVCLVNNENFVVEFGIITLRLWDPVEKRLYIVKNNSRHSPADFVVVTYFIRSKGRN